MSFVLNRDTAENAKNLHKSCFLVFSTDERKIFDTT